MGARRSSPSDMPPIREAQGEKGNQASRFYPPIEPGCIGASLELRNSGSGVGEVVTAGRSSGSGDASPTKVFKGRRGSGCPSAAIRGSVHVKGMYRGKGTQLS